MKLFVKSFLVLFVILVWLFFFNTGLHLLNLPDDGAVAAGATLLLGSVWFVGVSIWRIVK